VTKEAEAWDGDLQYSPGDMVKNHGVVYRAKVPIKNPLIQPHAGSDETFWEKVPAKEEDKPTPLKPAESPATSTKA
jgi:hypothetical protein